MNPSRVTPEKVEQLQPNEVFVFGSNLRGAHGAGAALDAWRKFGARIGVARGRWGQSYAIPTKDAFLQTLPLDRIALEVNSFLDHARLMHDDIFLVTPIGCGLAGYSPEDIAPLFTKCPSNVVLPKCFVDILLSQSEESHSIGDLQVWWIPQVPMKAFSVAITTLEEGCLLLKVLAEYDQFQYENHVKPDYCNAGGIRRWTADSDGEGTPGWEDWYDEETGIDNPEDYLARKEH